MKNLNQITAIYQHIIHESERELQTVRRNIYYISLLRLVLFIGAIIGTYLFWSDGWLLWGCLAVLLFILFVWLVKRHDKWFYQKDWLQKKIEINEQELKSLQNDFSSFEGGEEFRDPEHLYTYDLDVFGHHSLFQCINRTATPVGKQRLAQWLNHHLTCPDEIKMRQEAVCELTPALEYRQQIRLFGLLYEGQPADMEEIKSWAAGTSSFRQRKLLRFLPYIVLVFNALAIILAALQCISFQTVTIFFVGFVLFSTIFSKRITRFQEMYGKKLRILSIYADQILLTEQQHFQSRALQDLKERLRGHDRYASQVVRELSQLMSRLDQRGNLMVSLLLNGCMLWELKLVMRIEKWRETYAKELPVWIDTIGEIEAYCSLATFAYNHPDYHYPAMGMQPFKLKAVALGHPLMATDKCVRNDITMDKKPSFIIVTGANMAGKSTYLRTVGINYLLACIGVPVWAEQMELYPSQLITSLRTTDSLVDNESYFFAELKRLKRIIDLLQQGNELFIVLDEILKGTNSMDKQKGSWALIKQFIQLRANGMVATHDLLLGSLVDTFPAYIRNYCFEADITGDELTFSYRIREGVAQNMNACFLMKKMGIVGLEE